MPPSPEITRPPEEAIFVNGPDSLLLKPSQLWGEMRSEFATTKSLAWRLLWRDLQGQYRQTLLGYSWAILPALATTVIWVFLRAQNVIRIDVPEVPYALFVLTGILLWHTFHEALFRPLEMVKNCQTMLERVRFPRESLMLASAGYVLFFAMARLIVICGSVFLLGNRVPATLALAPLGLLALVAFGTALGILITPLALLIRDVEHGLRIVMQFMFFLTPVIYPVPDQFPASLMIYVNPVAPLLVVTRDWITLGPSMYTVEFARLSGVTLVGLMLAILWYRLSLPLVTERLRA